MTWYPVKAPDEGRTYDKKRDIWFEALDHVRTGDNIRGRVKGMGQRRTINLRDGGKAEICEGVLVGKSSWEHKKEAEAVLTLWNEDVGKVGTGDRIEITNAYVSEFKGMDVISPGKFGRMRILRRSKKPDGEKRPAGRKPIPCKNCGVPSENCIRIHPFCSDDCMWKWPKHHPPKVPRDFEVPEWDVICNIGMEQVVHADGPVIRPTKEGMKHPALRDAVEHYKQLGVIGQQLNIYW